MQKKLTFFSKMLLIAAMSLFTMQAFAQQQVTGVVTDSTNGSPLPGTTIGIVGSSRGTIADAEGKFTIEVSQGQIIEVRTIGYRPETIKYTGQSSLSVRLASLSTILNQIVVVGYGTQKRSTLSGAVATLSDKVIQTRKYQ